MEIIILIWKIMFLICFFSFVVIFAIWLKNTIIYEVPQVSTFWSDYKVMKNQLWKYNLKWKTIVDLWSWRWWALRFFEKEFEMKTIWYEVDLWNVLYSRLLNKLYWCSATIIKKNYFKTKIKQSDFIYIYLFPELMKDIKKKIWLEAKPWTVVFSNAFKFLEHEPIDILKDEKWKEEVYIYKV